MQLGFHRTFIRESAKFEGVLWSFGGGGCARVEGQGGTPAGAMSGLCSVCGSPDLSVGGDGFSYCNVCGSQSQFFQDQAFDYDDTHLYNARNVRERGIARKESQLATQQTLATQASQLATQEDLAYFQASQFQSQYQSQFGDDLMPFSQNPSQPITVLSDLGLLESEFGLSESERLATRVRKVYVEGVQVLVQMQCEALVQKFGVTPLVCGILGPVWMKFVSSTCVYEDGWADEALLVAEAHHEKSDKEDSDEDEEESLAGLDLDNDEKHVVLRKEVKPKRKKRVSGEPWTTYGERTRFVWLRSLKARIPLRASLAITYLVCHLAREPVLPTDIINWAFEGTLPYLSAYTEIEKRSNWGSQLQLFKASKIFKPQRMTNARVVEYLASVIGDRIDLELPPIHFHAIARRFLRELDLPVERLAPYVCRLYEWFPSSGLWLTSQVSKFPTRVYVMAMLVVVFKILYKLDGRHRLPHKDSDAVSGVELGYETMRVQENEQWNSEEFVAKIKIVLKDDTDQVDDQEQLTEYLRYCRETIFANEGLSNDEDLRDHFWDLYEQSAEEGSLRGTIPKESEDVESDFDRNGLLLLGSQEIPRQKQTKTGKKSKKALSKLRTDPLLRGMEDLGFSLLDPPQDVPQEHEYWTYIITRDDIRPVHEDYLFVLRACAKIIDVDPRVVHVAILKVEKGIIEAEKKVSKFLALQKGISLGDGPDQMDEVN